MPHGERSCGSSAVLIEVSPGSGGGGALALGAGAFAGLESAAGATPLVAGACAVAGIGAGVGAASVGAGIARAGVAGLAAVAAGPATGGEGLGNGAAGVVAGVCAAVVGRSAAGGRGRTGGGSIGLARGRTGESISGRNAASIANVLKRNCKAPFDPDRTTQRPPWLHQSSVFMSYPPKAPQDATLWTANLSNKWRCATGSLGEAVSTKNLETIERR